MANLLIIDDEQAICWGLAELGKRLSHGVATASSAEQGLELAGKQRPDAILLDVRLPGMDGLTALPRLKELAPAAPVIVMTAHGDLSTAVEAVRQGAFDYIAKPFDLAQIERLIQRALAQPKAAAPAAIDVAADGLVGRTPAMQEVFKRIALVAPAEACVMLDAGRRERHRQGAGREGDSPLQPAQRWAVRRGQRRGPQPGARRERAVRPHSRRVHRRRSAAGRPPGRSRRRDAVSR
jgi:FixJ family two-component response regulator